MVDYHPVSFHFRVSTEQASVSYRQDGDVVHFTGEDIKFQSVSGLKVQIETETYRENGQNSHQHVLAKRATYPNLILKRGIYRPGESGFTKWCKKAFEEFKIAPINLTVELLNEEHTVLMYWKVIWAWPKSWTIADLNAERGEILIETLELQYNRFEFKTA